VNNDAQGLFALARRLDDLRVQSPRPLVSHEASRQRDGPINARLALIVPAPERGHKHRSQPQPHVWNWRSKAM